MARATLGELLRRGFPDDWEEGGAGELQPLDDDDYDYGDDLEAVLADLRGGDEAERRARLTRDIDPAIAATFTDAELDEIERKANKQAFDQKRKKALDEITALAEMTARVEHGLIPAEVLRDDATRARMNEKVKVRVNLPVGGGPLGFRVDGRLYREGETVTVTRAVYESLLEMHYRIHKAELEFSTLNQNYRNGTAISQLMTRSPPPFQVYG